MQRLSNGSIDPDSDVNRVIDYQETIEKQNAELTNSRTKLQELASKINELEESLSVAQKDLIKTQEQNVKLQRDLREVSNYFLILTGLDNMQISLIKGKYSHSIRHVICPIFVGIPTF